MEYSGFARALLSTIDLIRAEISRLANAAIEGLLSDNGAVDEINLYQIRSFINFAQSGCATKCLMTSSGDITPVLPKTVTAPVSLRRGTETTSPVLRGI